MIRRVCLVALLAASGSLHACKPRQERGSEVNDLNPGAAMNQAKDPTAGMRDKDQKVVVIYYANDTLLPRDDDPAKANLAIITSTLKAAAAAESEDPDAQRLVTVAEKLDAEWMKFGDIINNDISALTRTLCLTVPPVYQKSLAGFVVFRNLWNTDTLNPGTDYRSRSVRSLKYQFCRPLNSERTEGGSFEVPRNETFPILSQPLTHPFAFQRALETVRGLFPPAGHRYILITKSHGSDEVAIAPHLSVDMTDTLATEAGRESFVNQIKARKNIGGLDKMTDPILADMDDTLKKIAPPGIPKDVGVTKGDYIQILRDLGTGDASQAMNFPLVLMESCRSDLRYSKNNEDLKWVLSQLGGDQNGDPNYRGFNMTNVGWIYTSDSRGLAYDAVRYGDLKMTRYLMEYDFQDAFKSFLDSMTKGQK